MDDMVEDCPIGSYKRWQSVVVLTLTMNDGKIRTYPSCAFR